VTIRILIADDHAIVAEGLQSLIEAQRDMKVVGLAGDGREAVRLTLEKKPDVVVMDNAMPELNGTEAVRIIRKRCAHTRVVMLSMHSSSAHIQHALQAGAGGYVLKASVGRELVDAIRTVHAGRRYLSTPLADNLLDRLMSDMPFDSAATAGKATDVRMRAALLDAQRGVLERIAGGAPLEEILETLVRLIEEQAGDMRCAVLLADSAQQRLRFVAAPHIPEDYKLGIEPYLLIAPDMGSCGTAAFLRQPVYTRDTTIDSLWENCGDIAARNGLRAIWSTPIISDANAVLGTFAMYYGEPRLPAEEHIQLIDMAAQMARVAIEAKHRDESLRTVLDDNPAGILITDLAGIVVRVNRSFAKMLGYTPAELQRRSVADITHEADTKALIEELRPLGHEEIVSDRRYRSKSGAILWARERSALRRDAAGEARYVLTRIEKMTEAGGDPLERLSRREREVLELVIAGATSKEIGARLGISAASVDTYRSRLMAKLNIEDLPGLVRFAIRQGIASV
jgi:PAS domain S-box-containing protein